MSLGNEADLEEFVQRRNTRTLPDAAAELAGLVAGFVGCRSQLFLKSSVLQQFNVMIDYFGRRNV